jgi:hypothetical protein
MSTLNVANRDSRSQKINVFDVHATHIETGLVDRVLFRPAPTLPAELAPANVTAPILLAFENGEKECLTESFSQRLDSDDLRTVRSA